MGVADFDNAFDWARVEASEIINGTYDQASKQGIALYHYFNGQLKASMQLVLTI